MTDPFYLISEEEEIKICIKYWIAEGKKDASINKKMWNPGSGWVSKTKKEIYENAYKKQKLEMLLAGELNE